MNKILLPDPRSYGLRGIAMGVHGAQRLKPDDHGPVKALPLNHIRVAGHFKVQIHRHGQLIREQEFDNLVLNQGLELLGTGNPNSTGDNITKYCHIGTGTSTPTPSQTALDAFVASSAAISTAVTEARSGSPNYIYTVTGTFPFAQGAVVGNMSEIGISYKNTNGGLFSRALITDSGGSPTTITVASIDQVTVFYSVAFYPVTTSQAGSVVLAGTTYNFTIYPTNINAYGTSGTTLSSTFLSPYNTYPFAAFTNGNTVAATVSVAAAGTPLSGTVLTDSSIPGAIGLVSYSNSPGNPATSVNASSAYTSGSYLSTSSVTFGTALGNLSGGIQCMQTWMQFRTANTGGTGFSNLIYFSTPIPKTNTQTLTLNFRTSWGV